MAFENLKHAQRERLNYLDKLLFWNGAATRGSLMERFGISNPQAALDFKIYLDTAKSGTLHYDASSKRYLTTSHFERVVEEGTIDELEELLLAQKAQMFDSVPDLQHAQNIRVFRPLYQTLLAKQAVEIVYQSMRESEAETRWIAPMRFASDGERLHVRAWCYKREAFRDFIPARIDAASSFNNSREAKDIPIDEDWFSWAIMKLQPHHSLSDTQKRFVRIEFGFDGDFLEIKVRKALEFYTKRRWGLDQENPRLECVSTQYAPIQEGDHYEN